MKNINILAARIAVSGVGFVLSVLVARYVEQDAVGVYFFVMSYVYVAALLPSYGFGGLASKNIPAFAADGNLNLVNSYATRLLIAYSLLSLILILISFLLYKVNFLGDKKYLIPYMTATAILLAGQNVVSDIMRSKSKIIKSIIFSGGLCNVFALIFLTALYIVGGKSLKEKEVLHVFLAAYAIQLFLAIFFVEVNFKSTLSEKVNFFKILSNGKDFFFNSFSSYLLLQGGSFIALNNIVGTDAAVYGVVVRLMGVITMFGAVIYSSIYPRIVELYHKKNLISVEMEIRRAAGNVALMTGIILLPCIIFPGFVLKSLYGDEYEFGGNFFVIMCLASFFNMATGIRGQLLLLMGKERVQVFITIFCGIVSIFSTHFAVNSFGLIGVGVVYFVATLTQCGIEMFFVKKIFGIKTHPKINLS